jgi:hypothetical protein
VAFILCIFILTFGCSFMMADGDAFRVIYPQNISGPAEQKKWRQQQQQHKII